MNSTNLPSRLREAAFRRYEDAIAQIVRAFPKVVVLRPDGNVNTYCARLRDAMLSLGRHKWLTNKVNLADFDEYYADIIISHQGDEIHCGSREMLKAHHNFDAPAIQVDQAIVNSPSPVTYRVTSNFSALAVLCYLASQRALQCPIKLLEMDQSNVKWCEDNYDVALTKNEDGSYTLI
jgi:hypothetical protein